jgi:transcriptional regulator with XRE-family HTH domain
MTTFGALLETLLARRQFSTRSFARAVKSSKSSISGIVNGDRTPPLDRLDKWCEMLGLRGAERQQFLDLAALAHLPHDARPRFFAWYADYQHLKAEYAELMTQSRRVAER